MSLETAEFAYDLHAGLSTLQVPEFDQLQIIGMAATLAVNIKGLGDSPNPSTPPTLKKFAQHQAGRHRHRLSLAVLAGTSFNCDVARSSLAGFPHREVAHAGLLPLRTRGTKTVRNS